MSLKRAAGKVPGQRTGSGRASRPVSELPRRPGAGNCSCCPSFGGPSIPFLAVGASTAGKGVSIPRLAFLHLPSSILFPHG